MIAGMQLYYYIYALIEYTVSNPIHYTIDSMKNLSSGAHYSYDIFSFCIHMGDHSNWDELEQAPA